MLCLINFMTAVFWGQLSGCEKLSYSVTRYTCKYRTAYGFTSFFAVVLFLIQLGFTILLVMFRSEFITDTAAYDDISSSSTHHPGTFPYETTTNSPLAASADL
jgi:hypothetical protein